MRTGRHFLLTMAVVAGSIAVYAWSFHRLGRPFSLTLVLVLAGPTAVFYWFYRGPQIEREKIPLRPSLLFAGYTLAYLAVTYAINILASSITLWLVQFVIPLVLLKINTVQPATVGFAWKKIFAAPWVLLLACVVLAVPLVFIVRDSQQILAILGTWQAAIYLPLSILYMAVIVAFWEEFFFRGVVFHSLERITAHPAASIFLSAFLFGIYHVPMRYMNGRSEYFGDLAASFAATLNEQFILGLFLGLIVYKSRNVWHAVWLHAVINGVSYMYKMSQLVRF